MKHAEFKVRRVRRYRVPAYPSHLDPDPTLHPEPVAFPWKHGVVAAWLGLSATGFAGQDEGRAPKPTGVENPFAMEKKTAGDGRVPLNGLPHQTSPFGTGAPSYLSDAAAVKLIRKVFSEQGFTLQEKVQFRADGIAFEADGYDPKHKIGFVFVHYGNFGEGMLHSWMDRQKPGEKQVEIEDQIRAAKTREDLQHAIVRVWSKLGAGNRQALEKMMNDPKMQNPAELLKKYNEMKAEYDRKTLSMTEANAVGKLASGDKTFIAVVSQFDARFESLDGTRSLGVLMEKMSKKNSENPDLKDLDTPKPEDTPLGQLERAVREYIEWARRNGLQ